MGFSDRLVELGIEFLPVVAPVAVYVPATHFGDAIRTSGQPPLIDSALLAKGKVGSDVPVKDAKDPARAVTLNALAATAALADGLDGLPRVVHVTVFVSSAPNLTGRAAVANGVSEALGEIFGEAGRYSRSAVGAVVLPLDTPVEVGVQSATV